LYIRLADAAQYSPVLAGIAAVIFWPIEQITAIPQSVLLLSDGPAGIEIPRCFFGREDAVRKQLAAAAAAGVKHALCHHAGAVKLALAAGLRPAAGFGCNITNSQALAAYTDMGTAAAVLSPELSLRQTGGIHTAVPTGIFAYGRLPLMIFRHIHPHINALTDRMGISFPLARGEGYTELLNSAVTWLADKLPALPPLDFLFLHFTDETAEQVTAVCAAYQTGGPPGNGLPPPGFTRGMTNKGVE